MDEVTIEKVAEEAGVSKGAVFHYFDSKSELAVECLKSELRNYSSNIYSGLHEVENPEEKLRDMVDSTMEFFLENPKVTRFFVEIYDREVNGQGDFGPLVEFFREYKKYLEDVLRELEVSRPEVKTHLLIACLDGLAFQFFLEDEFESFPDVESLKDEIVMTFGETRLEEKGEG
ncbi:hypothetical protein AKJ53_01670 [candidate division MSBL1 archaeon SCGC-AAA382F02]|uniref:HTH tetR-type domain-containing protein n=1 Tax=candidate division MSBL1 archaeon SCGC-AAA382F02 TaxID=1698282 RepID=A0A133VHQ9_9EURY|nr:hypothetical protein AKJ53_01670 [candidate division MSBL1 archaeon SCGC-AAA382F02]